MTTSNQTLSELSKAYHRNFVNTIKIMEALNRRGLSNRKHQELDRLADRWEVLRDLCRDLSGA